MTDRAASSQINGIQVARCAEDTQRGSLILSTDLRDTIVEYMRRCLPHEGVGLLATRGMDSSLAAVHFYPGRNTDQSALRYTMDPADVLAALADMDREKTRLGAIVHSHPKTEPVPSPTDLVEAKVPSALSLIVGFSPQAELLAWKFFFDRRGVAVRFNEVPLVCRESSEQTRLGFWRRAGHNCGHGYPVKG